MNEININELKSLICLLDDPDDTIYESVKERIFEYGMPAITHLEEAWFSATDELSMQRILHLIDQINFNNVLQSFRQWLNQGNPDLLKGLILVAKIQYPKLNEADIIKQIGLLSQDIWLELNENLTAFEKIKVFNQIFYRTHNFSGNRANLYALPNIFINQVLETRKGNAVTLGILYSVLAQSLKMPVYGVNLPEHFILCYLSRNPVGSPEKVLEEDVLFYLNPFEKGGIFTVKELEYFIAQAKLPYEKSYFVPCSNVVIIRRLLSLLIIAYERDEQLHKAEQVKNLIQMFDETT